MSPYPGEVFVRVRPFSALNGLLQYLDLLEAKYGPLPSILATRAEYLEGDDPLREGLLLTAYELAKSRGDRKNLVFIAHFLARFYLGEDRRNLAEADRWLVRMREYLVTSDDSDYDDYERLRAEYRKLAITSPSFVKGITTKREAAKKR